MIDFTHYLDYGAMGAAIVVLLLAVALVFRVLVWVREILEMVIGRVQENTMALVHMAERIDSIDEEPL